MPVYLKPANLIVRKEAIEEKYPGGLSQFKSDFEFDSGMHNQEDDELVLLAFMGTPEGSMDYLIEKGLHYDEGNNSSNDFAILYSHFEKKIKTDWLEDNKIFAWHIGCQEWQKREANRISTTLMDDLMEEAKRTGKELFDVIKGEALN